MDVLNEIKDTLRQAKNTLLGITALDSKEEIRKKTKARDTAIIRRIDACLGLMAHVDILRNSLFGNYSGNDQQDLESSIKWFFSGWHNDADGGNVVRTEGGSPATLDDVKDVARRFYELGTAHRKAADEKYQEAVYELHFDVAHKHEKEDGEKGL